MFYLAFSFPHINKDRCPPVSKLEHGLNQIRAVAMTTSPQESGSKFEDVAAQVSTIGKWKLKVVRGELAGLERLCLLPRALFVTNLDT